MADNKPPVGNIRDNKGAPVDQSLVARVANMAQNVRALFSSNATVPPAETKGEHVGGRGEIDGTTFFAPQEPLAPAANNEARSRAFDYPTAFNIQIKPRGDSFVDFPTLRGFADSYDLLRLVIETRKDQIESYQYEIVARDGFEVSDEDLQTVRLFYMRPDKDHTWSGWLRMILEDVFVIDAVCIYPRRTLGGSLYSLDLIAGDTIKKVIDATGRTPMPPDPAYQQVLKGIPAVNYTAEELLYFMRNPRTNRVYGLSPVEQILMTVNIAIRRQLWQLNYYTEGNVPEAMMGLPDNWTIEQVQQFQLYWDNIIEGNAAQKRRVKFVPFDPTKTFNPKDQAMKDQFDEWLARLVCFAFSISPTALVKETNRATAESVQDAAKMEGLTPLLNWLKAMFDFINAECLGRPDIEFKWQVQKDIDPFQQAQIDEIYLRSRVVTVDEVRDNLGLPGMSEEQKAAMAPKESELPLDANGKPIKQTFPPKANANGH